MTVIDPLRTLRVQRLAAETDAVRRFCGSPPTLRNTVMGEMKGIGRIKIQPGKLADFKRLAGRCVEVVRARDPGTLEYEIVINEEEMSALVFERYESSEAGLAHSKNIAELSSQLAEISEVSGEVWGHPSQELRQMLKSAGVTIYEPLASA